MLTKDEILNAKDLKTKVIEVPEWGGSVTIKALSLKEFTEIDDASRSADGKTTDNLKLAIATIIAGMSEPKFEKADVVRLQEKNSAVISRLCSEITGISGYGTDQKKASVAMGSEGIK